MENIGQSTLGCLQLATNTKPGRYGYEARYITQNLLQLATNTKPGRYKAYASLASVLGQYINNCNIFTFSIYLLNTHTDTIT